MKPPIRRNYKPLHARTGLGAAPGGSTRATRKRYNRRVGENRRYWSFVNALPAPVLVAIAQQAEAQGLQGLFAPQVYGSALDPPRRRSDGHRAFAAGQRDRDRRGPEPLRNRDGSDRYGPAQRRPLHPGPGSQHPGLDPGGLRRPGAQAARTAARDRGGRPSHRARRAQGPRALRGTLLQRGLRGAAADGTAPARGDPDLDRRAAGPAVRLAAEVAEGVIGHPMWSIDWAVERIQPDLQRGSNAAGASEKTSSSTCGSGVPRRRTRPRP